ncbi:MAG TPA: adenylate/guanylate cyclase domain-containing protein [Spirochaetia bacterium]|nr:adenylate/guanylate cyclase domain-containing protein [Spirochaetia bacterium]
MSIRWKIFLIVLPLIVATLGLTGGSSYFSSRNGITRIAKDFLGFKANELRKQAESQWTLLVQNNLTEQAEMVSATKAAVEGYARSIIASPTELIVALDTAGTVGMSTDTVRVLPGETPALAALASAKSSDLIPSIRIAGKDRVAKGFWFEPFQWYVLVTEERAAFYSLVNETTFRTGIILLGAIGVGTVLVLIFAGYLTRPLTRVAGTMKSIISTNDLSQRVVVEYHDEIGQLAQTFNLMVEELEKAYHQIKQYAFNAVLAQKKEMKTRNIFQLYVPKDVIDKVLGNPDEMLVGKDEILAVLFSDIRSFTSISEKMKPDDLVSVLNSYFKVMVDVIMKRDGTVDKYIGDAIMAFFGAPIKHEDDGLRSVMTGLEMIDALHAWNAGRQKEGKEPFHIGIGIHYGVVTVGNMGMDKKMNYTVIGDTVNLASRLEGLTKYYHQTLIFSESLLSKVKDKMPTRLLDTVAVKGKKKGVRIYTATRRPSLREKEAWELHNAAMAEYYQRNFSRASSLFKDVQRVLPGDEPSRKLLERSQTFLKAPPPASWVGVHEMTEK